MDDTSSLERLEARRVRQSSGPPVGGVDSGQRIVVCRRSTPLAVLLPRDDYAALFESHRGDQQIAAVLRGRGVLVEPRTTRNVIGALARMSEQS